MGEAAIALNVAVLGFSSLLKASATHHERQMFTVLLFSTTPMNINTPSCCFKVDCNQQWQSGNR